MDESAARISQTLAARGNVVAENFRQSAEALVAAINDRGEAVKDMLAERLKAFENVFQHGGTELTEKVARDTSTLGNLITRQLAEFDRTVKTYGGELVERLGTRTQDVAEAMRNYIDTFDQRVGDRSGELSSALDERISHFDTLLGSRVSGLSEAITTGGADIAGSLDKRMSEITGVIDTRANAAAEAIGAKAGEIDSTLGRRAQEVADHLDSRIGRFEELLVGRAETVTTQIETRTKAAADALNARMEELSESIKVNTAEAERALGTLAIATSDAIRLSAGEAERKLTGVSEEVARAFTGKAAEIAGELTRHAETMTTVLSDKSGGVLDAIAQRGAQFAGAITGAADQAVRAIDEKGLTFSRAVLDNGAEITRLINSAGENAAGAVNRTMNELHAATLETIERAQNTAGATVKEMLETHNMLRADTTALFERLREANILLQEVLSGSHENMSALENTLHGARIGIRRRHERGDRLDRRSHRPRRHHHRQFPRDHLARGRRPRPACPAIRLAWPRSRPGHRADRPQQPAERTVGRRAPRPDRAARRQRSIPAPQDIEQRLSRFSSLLDESLEAAASRARDVARVVSESSVEGMRVIGEQYERVRESAEDERRRTAEAMRTIFAQASGETDDMFRDASERFAEVMVGMKQMAAEMQRELEATRSELRRGIFDLPQETAESAAQMRRVIVDQIEALAELNRIVARHGRALDAVEPRAPQRPRGRVRSTLAGGRNESAATRETAARNPAPRQETGFAPPTPRRSETPRPPACPIRAAAGSPTCLSRASREGDETSRDFAREPARNEERTPRHSIESLNSLSVDIARMIDHDAAADLWDRYKRGERNVFTRRLYTMQGQKAFDEIRRKYRADREFKQTVDRYIGEFERLLDEVSRDDRGQVVARTYLTSETGKVYTMLAHAAGRFD